jgi:hypothetical protein
MRMLCWSNYRQTSKTQASLKELNKVFGGALMAKSSEPDGNLLIFMQKFAG